MVEDCASDMWQITGYASKRLCCTCLILSGLNISDLDQTVRICYEEEKQDKTYGFR